MSTELKDLPGIRILLAGAGTFTSESVLADLPAVAPTINEIKRVLVERCGMAPESIRELLDPRTPVELGRAIADVTEQAEDLVILYYVGHGLVASDGGLYLSTAATLQGTHIRHSAVAYHDVRQYLLESPARHRVVVLDCCFSGRAAGALSGPDVAGLTAVSGSFVLTSAGREEVALAPPGEPLTAFSGRLIRLLDEGDPAGPAEFDLRYVYEYLARVLPAAGFPRPRTAQDGNAGALVIAPNRAYRPRADGLAPTGSPPAAQTCPYLGLAAFGMADERWFYGRRRLTAIATSRLTDSYAAGRPLLVAGASGSGKSSLLLAGLVPAVRHGRLGILGSAQWPLVVMKPGTEPVASLRRLLGDGTEPAMLVVDQGEEIFTECPSESEREVFTRILDDVASRGSAVVVSLRSDFLGQWVELAERGAVVDDKVVMVRAMSFAEIRQAIVAPARAAGLDVESGLLQTLLADLGAVQPTEGPGDTTEAYEAGRLPLLSHALRMTWEYSDRSTLTNAAYQRSGGIRGALRSTADNLLAGFDEAGRQAARDSFLRLVHVGEGVDDTRRRVARRALLEEVRDPELADHVIDVFSGDRGRLLTVDAGAVEITHEALLTAWPTLRAWIDEDKAGLVVHQQLVQAAEAWSRNPADSATLLMGGRLAAARTYAADARHRLPVGIIKLLEASTLGERRRARFRAGVFAGLSLLLVLSLAGGAVALNQWRTAAAQRREAVAQTRVAVARSVQVKAESLRRTDPRRSLLMGIAANKMMPGTDTAASLSATLNVTRYTGRLPLDVAAFNPNRRIAVRVVNDEDNGKAELWDIGRRVNPLRLSTLAIKGDVITSVAFTADGRRLALGLRKFRTVLWDVRDLRHARQQATMVGEPNEGDPGMIDRLAFTPDGKTLVTANMNGHTILWNTASLSRPVRLAILPERDSLTTVGQPALAFSRDGRTLFTARGNGGFAVWDMSAPGGPRVLARATDAGTLTSLALAPDGKTLATGADDNSGTLWNVSDHRRPILTATVTGHTKAIDVIAFSADGMQMATAGTDQTVLVWDVSRRNRPTQVLSLSGTGGPVHDLFYSPDGRTLAAAATELTYWTARDAIPQHRVPIDANGNRFASKDGRGVVGFAGFDISQIAVWNLQNPRRPIRATVPTGGRLGSPGRHVEPGLFPAGISSAGGMVALRSSTEISLWDYAGTPGRAVRLAAIPAGSAGLLDGTAAVFRPDGRAVAVQAGKQMTVWDLTDPRRPTKIYAFDQDKGNPHTATFRPDGTWLAVAGETLWLFRLDRPRDRPVEIPAFSDVTLIREMTFSPDGRKLAAANADGVVAVWDVARPKAPKEIVRIKGTFQDANSVAFSPDGTVVAVGAGDGTANLWSLANPSQPFRVAVLTMPAGTDGPQAVMSLGFDADGSSLRTFSEDAAIVWNIDWLKSSFADPVTQACDAVQAGMTPQQWAADIPGAPFEATCN